MTVIEGQIIQQNLFFGMTSLHPLCLRLHWTLQDPTYLPTYRPNARLIRNAYKVVNLNTHTRLSRQYIMILPPNDNLLNVSKDSVGGWLSLDISVSNRAI